MMPGIVCCSQKILFVVGPVILHLPLKAQLLLYHQFNIHKFHVLPTHSIYVFCVDLRTNSDYFPIQINLCIWVLNMHILLNHIANLFYCCTC